LGGGRRLLIGDVSPEILENAAATLTAEGYDVSTCLIDVAERDSVRAFARKAAVTGQLTTRFFSTLYHELFNEAEPGRGQVLMQLADWLGRQTLSARH